MPNTIPILSNEQSPPRHGYDIESVDGDEKEDNTHEHHKSNILPKGSVRQQKQIALQKRNLHTVYAGTIQHKKQQKRSRNRSSSMSSLSTATAKSTAKYNNNTTSNTNTKQSKNDILYKVGDIVDVSVDDDYNKAGELIRKDNIGNSHINNKYKEVDLQVVETLQKTVSVMITNKRSNSNKLQVLRLRDESNNRCFMEIFDTGIMIFEYIEMDKIEGKVKPESWFPPGDNNGQIIQYGDNCFICGGCEGKLFECDEDGCLKSFHEMCLPPNFKSEEDDWDDWECPCCVGILFGKKTKNVFNKISNLCTKEPFAGCDQGYHTIFPEPLLNMRYELMLLVEEKHKADVGKKRKSCGSSARSGSGKKLAAEKNEEASTTSTPTKDDESPSLARGNDEGPSASTRHGSTASSSRDKKKSGSSSECSEDESSGEESKEEGKKSAAKTSNEPKSARSTAPPAHGGSNGPLASARGGSGRSTLSNNLPSAQALGTLSSAPELTVKPPSFLHEHKYTNLTLLTKSVDPMRTTYEATCCGVTSIVVTSGEVTCRVNRGRAMGNEYDEVYSLARNTLPIQLVNGDEWKLENWSQNYEAHVLIVESMF